jgi:hypothetical protein
LSFFSLNAQRQDSYLCLTLGIINFVLQAYSVQKMSKAMSVYCHKEKETEHNCWLM